MNRIKALFGFFIRPRVLVVWALLVAVIWGYWWALQLSRRPAIGTVTKPSEEGSHPADVVRTPQKYAGKYVEFDLAADYRLSRSTDPKAEGETFVYVSANSRPARQLAVEIALDRKLDDDPSYRLRKDNPQEYKQRISQVGAETVVVFDKAGGTFERVVFWRHQNRLATIALTAPNSADATAFGAELDAILASWIWK